MKKSLFLIIFVNSFFAAVGQEEINLFDQLHENVWYLPTEDGLAQLYITSIGKGDTIIGINGGPGNNFNYLVDAVRGNSKDNTFILFDQRGSIFSPVEDSLIEHLTIDVLVEDLEILRKALKIDKLTLLGHSFGTLLAMSYYSKYPKHVKGMILTATMPPNISEETPFQEILPEIHSRLNNLRKRTEVSIAVEKAGLSTDSLLSAKQRSDKFKITGLASFNMIEISNWKKFKGGGVYYNPAVDGAIGSSIPETYDITPTLKEFPVPVIVIQGDRDYIDPSATYWEPVVSNFQSVDLFVVKNASHNSWLDDMQAFSNFLEKAIKKINNH